jgi:hypothetical protein
MNRWAEQSETHWRSPNASMFYMGADRRMSSTWCSTWQKKLQTFHEAKLSQRLSDGTAWRKFVSLIYAQDGDASSLEKLAEIHRAPVIHPFVAQKGGIVKKMDPERLGESCTIPRWRA